MSLWESRLKRVFFIFVFCFFISNNRLIENILVLMLSNDSNSYDTCFKVLYAYSVLQSSHWDRSKEVNIKYLPCKKGNYNESSSKLEG